MSRVWLSIGRFLSSSLCKPIWTSKSLRDREATKTLNPVRSRDTGTLQSYQTARPPSFQHLRNRWRDSRAAEWAFWTVNPDYPRSPAGSFLDLRAEYEQRSRRARSRLGPGDLNSARTAELHRKGIGDSEHCLLQVSCSRFNIICVPGLVNGVREGRREVEKLDCCKRISLVR